MSSGRGGKLLPKAPSKAQTQANAKFAFVEPEEDEDDEDNSDEQGASSSDDSASDEQGASSSEESNSDGGSQEDDMYMMSGALHLDDVLRPAEIEEPGVTDRLSDLRRTGRLPQSSGPERTTLTQSMRVLRLSEKAEVSYQLFNRATAERSPLGLTRPKADDVETMNYRLRMLNELCMTGSIMDDIYISNLPTASAYLTGNNFETLAKTRPPPIASVLSIIDYKDRPDDKTLIAIQPHRSGSVHPKRVMRLNMKDSVNVRFYEWFPKICKFIHEQRGSEVGGVLVHCRKGMSRSVTAVLAYLIWAYHMHPIRAFKTVSAVREVAWPNKAFQRQLQLWYETDCKITTDGGDVIEKWHDYQWEGLEGLLPAVVYNPLIGEVGPEPTKIQSEIERPPKPEPPRVDDQRHQHYVHDDDSEEDSEESTDVDSEDE